MDLRLALMCGIDIPFSEAQAVIHQPTLKEIAFIGEKDFFLGVQCLSINKDLISLDNFVPENTSNFQIFMTVMSSEETKSKKDSCLRVLQLMFPQNKILFTPRSIILTHGDNTTSMIDENNFDIFQEYVKDVFCLKSSFGDQQNYNPGNEKAKEIAAKLMRGRQRVAAQKGDADASVFTQYISTLTVGLGSMSIFDVMNLTMFQLYDLVERYMLYVNWDIDIRSRLAGATIEKQPDNWMKGIH